MDGWMDGCARRGFRERCDTQGISIPKASPLRCDCAATSLRPIAKLLATVSLRCAAICLSASISASHIATCSRLHPKRRLILAQIERARNTQNKNIFSFLLAGGERDAESGKRDYTD